MGQPAAKLGDKVQGVDMHIVLIPSPAGPVPTPIPHPFRGTITGGTSQNVVIQSKPAATVNSRATNLPPHTPLAPGPFQKPPSNQGIVIGGSSSVMINAQPASRAGDKVQTCNDPTDSPTAFIVSVSTVMIG